MGECCKEMQLVRIGGGMHVGKTRQGRLSSSCPALSRLFSFFILQAFDHGTFTDMFILVLGR